MATNASANSVYGGTYELGTTIGHKLFKEDKHYDENGKYSENIIDKKNRWIRDINISIEDSEQLTLSLFSSAPDNTGEDIGSVVIDPLHRKNFIAYLKQVISMLER